eukprot:1708588-Alexandrium_andersonii.AAC.1
MCIRDSRRKLPQTAADCRKTSNSAGNCRRQWGRSGTYPLAVARKLLVVRCWWSGLALIAATAPISLIPTGGQKSRPLDKSVGR